MHLCTLTTHLSVCCSADEVQELMGCTFTSRLLFQRTSLLVNYAFWGFADCVIDGFDQIPIQKIESNEVSSKVAIGHVASLAGVEKNPLGLFALEDIATLTFLGEYTGVLQVHNDGVNTFDSYGVSYPSVYEHGDLYVSALEYGNAIRCINHSSSPNARFVPMIQGGILHIFCVCARHLVSTCVASVSLFSNRTLTCVCTVHHPGNQGRRSDLCKLWTGVLEIHWN